MQANETRIDEADVLRPALTALSTAALAACGGGGGGDGGTTTAVAVEPVVAGRTVSLSSAGRAFPTATTDAQAARFLLQSQLSASDADIASVRSMGYAAWLQSRIAQSHGGSAWFWLNSKGYDNVYSSSNFYDSTAQGDYFMWYLLFNSPDQARRRMALALSEIFVVSLNGLELNWRSHAAASYWDTLCTHAFGNYRDLLEAVTLNVAMGYYLNTKGNRKADGRGSQPDENYAREVMQLFSIGLVELNMDGTPRLNGGNKIDTYGASDVSNLAHIFTGYDVDQSENVNTSIPQTGGGFRTVNNTAFARKKLIQVPSNQNNHSTVRLPFLTSTAPVTAAPAGAAPALQFALDKLFNHANTAPFICKQLIQRLVTSNPSPAYVQRVANVFVNNGSGARGDLAFVYAAILLDDEARSPAGLTGAEYGKLREPMLRMVQWGRTFGASSSSGAWKIGDHSDPGSRLGQSPLRSGSVFNFFRPGYVPTTTALSAGTVVPEFQLVNESSVGGYLNYMQGVIGGGINFVSNGVWDIMANYSTEIGLATSPSAAAPSDLVNRINLLLTASQLSPANVTLITNAVGAMASANQNDRRNRVCAAILLVMASAEYLVQK
jgi:uncharacterized protein (DUF1800 family)